MENFEKQLEEAAKSFYESSYGDYPSGFVKIASIDSFTAGALWYKNQLKSNNYDTTPRNNEVANGIGPIGII